MLDFPARLLSALPVPLRIGVQAHGIACTFDLAAPAPQQQHPTADTVAFDGDELCALAVAAENERVRLGDFKGYCLRKLHDPSFRVTTAIALAGAHADEAPSWSLGRVLRWLELELVAIELLEAGTAVEPAQARASDAARHANAAAA